MTVLNGSFRLLRTIRHLKPVQVYGRLWNRVKPRRCSADPAPKLRNTVAAFVRPAPRPPSLFENGQVRFLNVDGHVTHATHWNDTGKTKLWLYNLHYFDGLHAPDCSAQLKCDLMDRWIAENPCPQGNGWEPYPLSLRIANWIKWSLFDEPLRPAWNNSLAAQVRYLAQSLEWHLLGNHLMANAKGLVMAGLYFEGEEADGWLKTGLSIFERQLPEQILSDGGHFERSPMYHAIILEDLFDLINVSRAYGFHEQRILAELPVTANRMRNWLAAMTHPDGGPAFFNDCAFDIASSHAELEDYAQRLILGAVELPDEGVVQLDASGYVRVTLGAIVAIVDLAPIGPDYIPGHAHADTLSFELSFGKERIIVNGGTSTYEAGERRAYERSTVAHSTVTLDDQDSSEVWASFRVARRAYPSDIHVFEGPCEIIVEGSHTGYTRLNGSPKLHRKWRFGNASLTIEDRIDATWAGSAMARYHLGPNVTAQADGSGTQGDLQTVSGQIVRWHATEPASVADSTWARGFGEVIPTSSLSVALADGFACMTLDCSATCTSYS